MGKGNYYGGGTIIGPHTPDWFSSKDTTLNVVDASGRSSAPGMTTLPGSRPLTVETERQIRDLQKFIKALETSLRLQKDQLDRLLKAHGLA